MPCCYHWAPLQTKVGLVQCKLTVARAVPTNSINMLHVVHNSSNQLQDQFIIHHQDAVEFEYRILSDDDTGMKRRWDGPR